jgi:hypothetical protein
VGRSISRPALTLHRSGEIAWIPIALSALAIAVPRAAPVVLAAALFLFLVLPVLVPGRLGRPWTLSAAAAFFLFVCGATLFYQPGASLDLFEDGQILAPADTYLHGGRPYIDTHPVHGWGADGGLDAFFFRVFGATLETFRIRRAVMTALALVALAAAACALFEQMSWGGVALLAALGLCPFVSERQMLAFSTLFLLLLGARSGRRGWLAAAGAFGACQLFYSLDLGLVVLAGGLFGVVTRPFLASGLRRPGSGPRDALAFLGGALAASLPFLVLLARTGSLVPFLHVSFREIPRTIGDVWGLPAGSAEKVLRDPDPRRVLLEIVGGPSMPSLFLLLLLALAVAVLLLRSALRKFDGADSRAWISVAIAVIAFRGVLGRADAGHLALYGVFAGLPATWLLYRASRAVNGRVALTGATLVLLAPLRPLDTLSLELRAVAGAARERDTRTGEGVHLPRTGGATLPPAQAGEVSALRRYFNARLASDETFFDFGNEPGLYFLLGRRMPVRFASVPFYESPVHQAEVITRLEREQPPLAVLASGTGRDSFDGVSNRERAPRVAAYLDAAYEPCGEIQGRKIGRRRANPETICPRSP